MQGQNCMAIYAPNNRKPVGSGLWPPIKKATTRVAFLLVGTSGLADPRPPPYTSLRFVAFALRARLHDSTLIKCFAFRRLAPRWVVGVNSVYSPNKKGNHKGCFFIGRDKWTRTTDPHLIRVVL